MQRVVSALFLLVFAAFGQTRGHMADYAVLLADAPVAQSSQSRLVLQSAAVQARVQSIRNAQRSVLAELHNRKVAVRGASQILLNAIFVSATRETAAQLLSIPGVAHVVPAPLAKRDLDQALSLENVTAAWNAVGGVTNAGAGIKIGIIDTGIDQTHLGFQDASLTVPSGFPKGDTNYTNNKVIVARSYVKYDTDPSNPNSPDPTYSTPDDYSPRDHIGHGTAIAMIAAGAQNTGPQAVIQGVAPKAFLGNYKVFGSPGVNDYAAAFGIQAALTDAVADKMDIVTLSLGEGNMPDYGPLDVDPSCSSDGTTAAACDIYAQMVNNAVAAGLVVVTSAGNDGNLGTLPHTLSTVHTPGTVPSAITVGASMNSHVLYQTVRILQSGGVTGVPSGLQAIHALASDGPQIARAGLALIDAASLHDNGLACAALPAGSLTNDIALIQRGVCPFSDKIINAENAGALGVLLYQQNGNNTVTPATGTENTGIPAMMISFNDGIALKNYLSSNSGVTATFDLRATPTSNPPNSVWPSSSRGPSIGTFSPSPYQTFVIKPELVAVGAGIYTATQHYDPNGDAYNADGYTGVSGTSYAVPMVAGAVALVKQKHPTWTPAQLKSAVVNTATQDVTDTDGSVARVDAVGAGKLSAGDAVSVAATLDPATLEFGALTTSTVSNAITLNITNVSAASATFSFAAQPRDSSSLTLGITPGSLTLAAGQTNSVSVKLTGTLPGPGSYEGFIVVTGGGGPTLRVPYQFLVGSGTVADVFPVYGGGFIAPPSDTGWPIQARAIDAYGVPVVSSLVVFSVGSGGGIIGSGDKQTFRYGIATGFVNLGSQPGLQIFNAKIGNVTTEFDAYARPFPAISQVIDGAAYQPDQGLAPGSYIAIKGTNLADVTQIYSTNYLPVSLSGVSVSFDDGGLSVPGHFHFVSPGQINVQVPWEFEGHSSVQMKVTVTGFLASSLFTGTISPFVPAFFLNNGTVADAVEADCPAPYYLVGTSCPATRGQLIQLYASGLGPVNDQPASGEPALVTPLSHTNSTVTVSIGGQPADVQFAGLAPGFVGLYQVNAIVPTNISAGTQPITISVGGKTSPLVVNGTPVTIPVR